MKRRLLSSVGLGLTLLVGLLWLLAAPELTAAAPRAQETGPLTKDAANDETCLGCHGAPGQVLKLEDGTDLELWVDPAQHASSIHVKEGLACVDCHTTLGEYPHPAFSAADRRDVTLKLNSICQSCHTAESEKAQNSVHAQAQSAGQRAAATCTDCHTAHAVQAWVDPATGKTLPSMRPMIPQTCAQCHNTIYQQYAGSVHGSALFMQNNLDVPTCIDCHGVHDIGDPTTNQFRLASPQMCAQCHTDPAIMAKYGISTNVLDTYVADFHGTTVTIFEQENPEEASNKPVCYDCHGVHNILRADDPQKGLQIKENLLRTCQRCHPDAGDNFPTAWMSHYIPSPEKYPLVYYVDLFYKFLIPTVLGGMALLVVLDAGRSVINWRRKKPTRVEKEEPVFVEPQVLFAEEPAEPEAPDDGAAEEPAEPEAPDDGGAEETVQPEVIEEGQVPDLPQAPDADTPPPAEAAQPPASTDGEETEND